MSQVESILQRLMALEWSWMVKESQLNMIRYLRVLKVLSNRMLEVNLRVSTLTNLSSQMAKLLTTTSETCQTMPWSKLRRQEISKINQRPTLTTSKHSTRTAPIKILMRPLNQAWTLNPSLEWPFKEVQIICSRDCLVWSTHPRLSQRLSFTCSKRLRNSRRKHRKIRKSSTNSRQNLSDLLQMNQVKSSK